MSEDGEQSTQNTILQGRYYKNVMRRVAGFISLYKGFLILSVYTESAVLVFVVHMVRKF